jgi:hypothetical protein
VAAAEIGHRSYRADGGGRGAWQGVETDKDRAEIGRWLDGGASACRGVSPFFTEENRLQWLATKGAVSPAGTCPPRGTPCSIGEQEVGDDRRHRGTGPRQRHLRPIGPNNAARLDYDDPS